MNVKAVFNEPHEISPGNYIKEAQIHFVAAPATGDRVVLDDVSYIIEAINHRFTGNGAGIYSAECDGFTILLDRADERA